jgi:hypothetical protein
MNESPVFRIMRIRGENCLAADTIDLLADFSVVINGTKKEWRSFLRRMGTVERSGLFGWSAARALISGVPPIFR